VRSLPEIPTRNDLVLLIDALGLRRGVEIGVNTGDFSQHILSKSGLEWLGSVDGWTTETDDTRSVFRKWAIRNEAVEKAYRETVSKLSRFGARSSVIRKLSFDAVKEFADGSLDFIYVDASHRFSGVAMDLIQWWPKLREGGVFAGHDYWRAWRCEVMEVVNGFSVENKQVLHLTTRDLNNRGKGKYPPTWWVVRESLSKDEWIRCVVAAKDELLAAQAAIRAKGVDVILPYQYHEQWGMAASSGDAV